MDTPAFPFREVQRFRQWWIWPVMAAIASVPAILTYLLVFAEDAPKPVMVFPLVFAALFSLLPIVLLYAIRLETEITETFISYRFFPLHKKARVIRWEDVETATVRNYSPLSEYGGFGARVSMRNGVALNISGKEGIQLVLKNGRRMLIGTRRAEEVRFLLDKLQGNRR